MTAAADLRVTAPGFYPELTEAEYHADPAPAPSLSASIAKLLVDRSPAHAHDAHPRLGRSPRESTDAQEAGTLAHAILLGTSRSVCVIDADNYRSKAAQEQRDAAAAAGAIPVLRLVLDAAHREAESMRAALADAGVSLDGQSELSAVWVEHAYDGTEVWCRSRLDHLRADGCSIVDLKRALSAHPLACQRRMHGYAYDIQHAAYVSAVEHLRPELAGRVAMQFAFLEPLPSGRVVVTVVRPTGTMRELGQRRWKRAVDLWAKCLGSGKWPGYTDGPIDVEAAPWALAADMDQQLARGFTEPDWMGGNDDG